MRPVLISKFPFLVLISGPVGTWLVEGAEYSRRVFSMLGLAIGVGVDGTKEAGLTSKHTRWRELNWILALLTIFQWNSVVRQNQSCTTCLHHSKTKKTIKISLHWELLYLVMIIDICIVLSCYPFAFPCNDARKACWHLLVSALGLYPRQQRQKCLLPFLNIIAKFVSS
jgi:hypothetical protein